MFWIILCALNWLFAIPQVILYVDGSEDHPFTFNLIVAIIMTFMIIMD